MSAIEKKHLIDTFSYHLVKVKNKTVRQQNIDMFANVDMVMANEIASKIGANPSDTNHVPITDSSPVLSTANTIYSTVSRKVGVLIGDGFNDTEITAVLNCFDENNVFYEIVSEKLGSVVGKEGFLAEVKHLFITTDPVLFDAIYVVGGTATDQIKFDQEISRYVNSAYKHYKPIGVASTGQAYIQPFANASGIVNEQNCSNFTEEFIAAVAKQRFWDRI